MRLCDFAHARAHRRRDDRCAAQEFHGVSSIEYAELANSLGESLLELADYRLAAEAFDSGAYISSRPDLGLISV